MKEKTKEWWKEGKEREKIYKQEEDDDTGENYDKKGKQGGGVSDLCLGPSS